jgi:hypothetical protein
MTKADFFSLAFKIIGLYFFVMVVTSAMQIIAMMINFDSSGWGEEFWVLSIILVMIFGVIIYLVVGYYLTFRTEKILSLLKIQRDDSVLKAEINKTDVIEIALAIIAVIAMVFMLPRILADISGIVYFSEADEFGNRNVEFDQDSIAMLIQVFIGVFLLFNARNFAKWIVRRGEKDDQIDRDNKFK